jgi:hypothetical protein
MNDIERFCAVCADEGFQAALRGVGPDVSREALCEACRRQAVQAQRQGQYQQADRLHFAALSLAQPDQSSAEPSPAYLAYLELPYHLD